MTGSWVPSAGGSSAVPEFGNVALIGLGLVAIGLVRRKTFHANIYLAVVAQPSAVAEPSMALFVLPVSVGFIRRSGWR